MIEASGLITAGDVARPIRMVGTVVSKRERVGKRGNTAGGGGTGVPLRSPWAWPR